MFKPKLRASVRCAAILGVGLALMLESLQIAKGDVVVSTLANSVVGQDSTPTTNAAQGFTTGNQAETLQSVTLEFTGSVGDAPEVISLFSDSSDSPGSLISTLGTITPSVTGTSEYSLVTPAIVLAASTSYWLEDQFGSDGT